MAKKNLIRVYICSLPVLAYCAIARYPPLRGIDMAALIGAIWVIGGALLGSGDQQRIIARHVLASLLPWVAAAIFLANGLLDRSSEQTHQVATVGVHYFLTSFDTITIRSWLPDRATETFFYGTYKYGGGFIYAADPITLGVRSGAFGIIWIDRLSRP